MFLIIEYDSIYDKEGHEIECFETFEEADEYITESDPDYRCFMTIKEI